MPAAKNILVLTYWSFDDALIQTYTLPYLRIIRDLLPEGSTVYLLTLEKNGSSTKEKQLEKGISAFSFPLIPFGLKAALNWRKNISWLADFAAEKNISSIHTWCTPAGAIGYYLSKRTGIPLILDSYEPHAQPMIETGTWSRGGIAFRFLSRLEKKQTLHAKWIIGVVPAMKEYAKKNFGFEGDNFFFKPACIDLQNFNLSRRKNPALLKSLGLENKLVCVYAGKFGGLYLEDEAFLFFKKAFEFWGDKFRVLLLTNNSREEIDALCLRTGMDKSKIISKFVPHKEIADYLGLGDFAFSAYKPVPSRKYCTPIKNGEYWAMGLPVIIPVGISEDSEIVASSHAGYVLQNLSEAEMEKAVQETDQLIQKNADGKLSGMIHGLAMKHRNFEIAKEIYRKIYEA